MYFIFFSFLCLLHRDTNFFIFLNGQISILSSQVRADGRGDCARSFFFFFCCYVGTPLFFIFQWPNPHFIDSQVRADDAEIVHEVCALAWNLSLPVLQPNIRKQAKRVLSSCAKVLEEMVSPLHELRAQVHLEVARCDVADDLYAAAAVQVCPALLGPNQ
jgi:hypothetical protein